MIDMNAPCPRFQISQAVQISRRTFFAYACVARGMFLQRLVKADDHTISWKAAGNVSIRGFLHWPRIAVKGEVHMYLCK